MHSAVFSLTCSLCESSHFEYDNILQQKQSKPILVLDRIPAILLEYQKTDICWPEENDAKVVIYRKRTKKPFTVFVTCLDRLNMLQLATKELNSVYCLATYFGTIDLIFFRSHVFGLNVKVGFNFLSSVVRLSLSSAGVKKIMKSSSPFKNKWIKLNYLGLLSLLGAS